MGNSPFFNEEMIGIKLFLAKCYMEKNLIEDAKLQLTEAKQIAQKFEVDVRGYVESHCMRHNSVSPAGTTEITLCYSCSLTSEALLSKYFLDL